MGGVTHRQLVGASTKLLRNYLRIKPREHIALVTDGFNPRIIKAVKAAAEQMGHPANQIHVIELANPQRAGSAPIPEAEALFRRVHVVIAPTRMSITHSKESVEARKRGVRMTAMAAISPATFVRALAADQGEVKRRTQHLNGLLSAVRGVREVKIVGDHGTDLTMKIDTKSRPIKIDDGTLHTKGSSANMPIGEVFVAPLEDSLNGTFAIKHWAIDGVKGKGIAELSIKDGKIIGGNEHGKKIIAYLTKHGTNIDQALRVAELGLGANPAFNFRHATGNPLPDEKIPGVHIAFGKNDGFGGTNDEATVHRDFVVQKPTVHIDGQKIMHKGRLLGYR